MSRYMYFDSTLHLEESARSERHGKVFSKGSFSERMSQVASTASFRLFMGQEATRQLYKQEAGCRVSVKAGCRELAKAGCHAKMRQDVAAHLFAHKNIVSLLAETLPGCR
jgi:hypothetical protein